MPPRRLLRFVSARSRSPFLSLRRSGGSASFVSPRLAAARSTRPPCRPQSNPTALLRTHHQRADAPQATHQLADGAINPTAHLATLLPTKQPDCPRARSAQLPTLRGGNLLATLARCHRSASSAEPSERHQPCCPRGHTNPIIVLMSSFVNCEQFNIRLTDYGVCVPPSTLLPCNATHIATHAPSPEAMPSSLPLLPCFASSARLQPIHGASAMNRLLLATFG